jgi:hypothetical protein
MPNQLDSVQVDEPRKDGHSALRWNRFTRRMETYDPNTRNPFEERQERIEGLLWEIRDLLKAALQVRTDKVFDRKETSGPDADKT